MKYVSMDLKALQALLTGWASINSGSGNTTGLALMGKALSDAFSKIKGAKSKIQTDSNRSISQDYFND